MSNDPVISSQKLNKQLNKFDQPEKKNTLQQHQFYLLQKVDACLGLNHLLRREPPTQTSCTKKNIRKRSARRLLLFMKTINII